MQSSFSILNKTEMLKTEIFDPLTHTKHTCTPTVMTDSRSSPLIIESIDLYDDP